MRPLIFLLFSICSITISAQGIHRSACNGDLQRVDSLLLHNDVNVLDDNGRTPLLYATGCRRPEVFDLLLSRGADVNIGDKNGLYPILFAVEFQNQKFIDSLLAHRVNVNVQGQNGDSPLHKSVIQGNVSISKQLLAANANPNRVNKRGNIALQIAVREEYDTITEYLIAKGADKNKLKKIILKGEYLGQEPPGLTPKMFAPNVVSTENYNHTAMFHPNENEFYFTSSLRKINAEAIMVTKKEKGKWTKPERLEIFGDSKEFDSFITHDGKRLFYCSNRKVRETDTIVNADIWMMEREGNSWGKPIHLGNEVNSPKNDWFPTISKKGTLVFSPSMGREGKIVYSRMKEGIYQKPIPFGENINSPKSYNYDPLIAPDESYLIFASRREGNKGGADLYISFKLEDGTWSKAKNMGDVINTKTTDYAASLSPDGKYFFYTSNLGGSSDIYWVSSKVIVNLRDHKD
jgi:ankyrin repeat protein